MISSFFLDKKACVSFDDFNIDENVSLNDQLENLKEDMFQAEFNEGYILDIGWRPSFDSNGKFHLILVKEYDWENPVYSATTRNLKELCQHIKESMTKF